jgi:hypothetical protein
MSDRPRARIAGWALLALAGLAVAVALSVAASNLSTQPIGLTNEPLRAGERLAPPATTPTTTASKPAERRKSTRTQRTPAQAPTATTRAPTVTTPPPTATGGEVGDDHGGRRGRGRGSDD